MDYKEERDNIHKLIQELKIKRDAINKQIEIEFEVLNGIKNTLFENEIIEFNNLVKELRELEKQHMTSVMSVEQEKNIIKNISKTSKKIKNLENKFNENIHFKEQKEKIVEMKLISNECHEQILKLSEIATEYHKKIMESK